MIEQQQQVMISTDIRVNALTDRTATVLNVIWFNVFRPGARHLLRSAEFDRLPLSMLAREPFGIKNVTYQLRRLLAPQPGCNMPKPQDLVTFDPLATFVALETILDRTQCDLAYLVQEESDLRAKLVRLEQLSQQVLTAARAGLSYGLRGCVTWKYDHFLLASRSYDDYRRMKEQDPSASYLETFDKFEIFIAANPFRWPVTKATLLPPPPPSPSSYRRLPHRDATDARFCNPVSTALADTSPESAQRALLTNTDLPNGVSQPLLPTSHGYVCPEPPGKASSSSDADWW